MKISPYSLDDIYWVSLIADAGSLSKASRRYNLPKSTLSRRLKRLEKGMGATIVHRNSVAFSLTDQGKKLVEDAQPLLQKLRDIGDAILIPSDEPTGIVRVTASNAFGEACIIPIINEFIKKFPLVGVNIELTDRSVDVVENAIDIAVRIGELKSSELRARRVGEARRILCASTDYARLHGTPDKPDELNSYQLVSQGLKGDRISLKRDNEIIQIQLNGRYSISPSDSLLRPILAGVGIGHLAEAQCIKYLASGRLVRVLPEWEIPPYAIHLVSGHRRYRSPAVETLWQSLLVGIPDHLAHLKL